VVLNAIWFILIGVLFAGYFFLEGFDLGVGILVPFLGKNDLERRVMINTFGPFWDANEVWLITAGGAMFAAFSNWYATLFSGFYLALFPILISLIMRAVAMEFRNMDERPGGRCFWDWSLSLGSLIPSFLWGVAFANLLKGVPIDERMNFVGTFFDLLSPYTLLGGLVFLTLFIAHGSLFLTLRVEGDLVERAKGVARIYLPTAWLLLLVFFLWSIRLGIGSKPLSLAFFLLMLAALAGSYGFLWKHRCGWALISGGLGILFLTARIFSGLFPNVMISSLNPQWNLTIYNAASNPYTLKVMTTVAVTFVPIVLLYQGWSYWIFRERLKAKEEELVY